MLTHGVSDDLVEGCVDVGEGEGEKVGLCVEDKVVYVQQQVALISKQQVEVLEGLGQDI